MKFFKDNYGNWKTTAHFHTKSGQQVKNYMEIGFQNGSEPGGENYEAELILRSPDGTERPCFFSGYKKKNDEIVMKMVVLVPGIYGDQRREEPKEEPKNVQTSLTGTRETVDGHIDQELIIDEKDLPFY